MIINDNPDDVDEMMMKFKELLKKIRVLEKELDELVPIAENTSTMEGTKQNVDKVMNDPDFAQEGERCQRR